MKVKWSKKQAVELYAETGTLKDVAIQLGISKKELVLEMKRSKVFGQKMKEAGKIGREYVGDDALSDIIHAKELGLEKAALTAKIAVANAYAPDFKKQPTFQPTKQTFNVITGIPRPNYKELPEPKEEEVVKTTALTIREDKEVVDK